jgi:hypothetical protein
MRNLFRLMILGSVVVSLGLVGLGQGAAAQQDGVPVSVTVTVTAKGGKTPPEIPQNEVVARQDGTPRHVISWVPANGSSAGVDLIVLADEKLGSNIANRWSEMRDFLRAQPASTREGIAYSDFGAARFEQELTTDHEKAAGALRIPNANHGGNTGLYDSGRDLIANWPDSGSRKVVVLISDGQDLSDGGSDTDPDRNISLQRLIDKAQQAGVVFYAIYARGGGDEPEDIRLLNNAQGSLASLARETGGASFFDGFTSPVSLQPYLQDIGRQLGEQYILTFAAKTGKKADYSPLKIVVETNNVEVHAPDRVYVPAAQ